MSRKLNMLSPEYQESVRLTSEPFDFYTNKEYLAPIISQPGKGIMATKQKDDDQSRAQSAWEVLNDLMGEIHAGRVIYFISIQNPQQVPAGIFNDILKKPFAKYYTRLGFGAIAIALHKYGDLWTHHLSELLSAEESGTAKDLANQVKEKRIREIRSCIFAHYSDNVKNLKTSQARILDLMDSLDFESDEDIINWTKRLVMDLDLIKKSLEKKFGVGPRKEET